MDFTPTQVGYRSLAGNIRNQPRRCPGTTEAGRRGKLDEPWTLRNGEQIYTAPNQGGCDPDDLFADHPSLGAIGVFLRLLDIPIPGSYGPSADDLSF